MKTFKFLFSTVVLFLIIGCSNDDSSEISSDQLILGNWIISDISINGDVTLNDNNIDPMWNPMPIEAIAETQNYAVNFSKPNQVTSNEALSISYVVSIGNYLNSYEYSENINVFNSGNWTLDYPFLTINSNGSNEKFGIITLSNNKFSVSKLIKDQFTLNNEFGEIVCTTNLKAVITFQKTGNINK